MAEEKHNIDHALKTDIEVFEKSFFDKKPWEIRFNDRDFKEGDVVLLAPTVYSGQQMRESGKPLDYFPTGIFGKIDYILHGPAYGLQEHWCIFTLNTLWRFTVDELAVFHCLDVESKLEVLKAGGITSNIVTDK